MRRKAKREALLAGMHPVQRVVLDGPLHGWMPAGIRGEGTADGAVRHAMRIARGFRDALDKAAKRRTP